jgi:hypothetical protein
MCIEGKCEYNPTLKRLTTTITPEQREGVLAFLYNARDQCLHEHREDFAISIQKEIDNIERR